jgi:hypothetical protein
MKSSVALSLLLLAATFDLSVMASDDSARTFRVTRDSADGSVQNRVEETVIHCYHYTWMGPVGDVTNVTESCGTRELYGVPCFEPLVWTDGQYKANGPNTTQIENKCAQGQTVDGKVCQPLCVKNEDVCVKVTYFRRDEHHTVENYTSFCGQGIKTTSNGAALKNSCHIEKGVGGYDKEVCFCNKDRCNGAVSARLSGLFLVPALFATTFSSHLRL